MKKKFGRFACLGRFTLMNDQDTFDNYQKLRIDVANCRFVLLDRILTSFLAVLCIKNVSIIKMVLKSTWFRFSQKLTTRYVLSTYFQSLQIAVLRLSQVPLVFAAPYSDLNFIGRTILTNKGRITETAVIRELNSLYVKLAALGCKKIVVLSYPTFREQRPDYIARAGQIDDALIKLCSENKAFRLLPKATDQSLPNIDDQEAREFPYHYSDAYYIQNRKIVMKELDIEDCKAS